MHVLCQDATHLPSKYQNNIFLSWPILDTAVLSDSEEIIKVIETLFEAGVTKDLKKLRDIHLNDPRFSSFSDLPPYDLKDYQTTIELEELRFVSISDYSYQIKNPKISIFGDAAVAAMELDQEGMLVDLSLIHISEPTRPY